MPYIFNHSEKGIRETNEDMEIIIDNKYMTVLGVCDGHGGYEVSKYISGLIPRLFNSSDFIHPIDNNQYKKICLNIQNGLKKNKTYNSYNSGCTCTLFIKYKNIDSIIKNNIPLDKTIFKKSNYDELKKIANKFITINIGDSRIIGCYKNNNKIIVEQLTKDHKPYDIKERNMIEKAGGEIKLVDGIYRVGGLSLSRSFGDCDIDCINSIPDIKRYKLNDLLFVVIACDGLYDVLENNKICQFIIMNYYDKDLKLNKEKLKKDKKENNPAYQLCKLALNNETQDNVSVIIYFNV